MDDDVSEKVGTTTGLKTRLKAFAKGRRSLVVALSILMAFASAEAALRVRLYIMHGALDERDIFLNDPVLGKVLMPGAKVAGSSSSLTVNRWGFRGHDFPLAKGKGVFRIAVVGDSVVFERFAVNDDSAWTARLEKELNGMQNRYRVEVINAGIPGFNVDSTRYYLEKTVSRFKPDLIVLYQGSNDINYQSKVMHEPKKMTEANMVSLPRLRERYFMWFNLLRAKTASMMADEQKSMRSDRIEDAAVKNYASGVRGIMEYCRSNKIKLVVSTVVRSFRQDQPERYQAQRASEMIEYNRYLTVQGLNDAFDRFNGAIRDLSGRYGVTLVDTDRLVPSKKEYFRDHVHFTDAGDRLVADIFAGSILKKISTGEPSRAVQ